MQPPCAVFPDGQTFATDSARIHELLLQEWSRFHQGETPPAEAFLAEYREEIADAFCKCERPPVSVQAFRKVLNTKNPLTKGGADGWQTAELQRLPDALHSQFLRLMQALEEGDGPSWPQGMNNVITVLLPKPDGGTRPISLVCMWVSVYVLQVQANHVLDAPSCATSTTWRSEGT